MHHRIPILAHGMGTWAHIKLAQRNHLMVKLYIGITVEYPLERMVLLVLLDLSNIYDASTSYRTLSQDQFVEICSGSGSFSINASAYIRYNTFKVVSLTFTGSIVCGSSWTNILKFKFKPFDSFFKGYWTYSATAFSKGSSANDFAHFETKSGFVYFVGKSISGLTLTNASIPEADLHWIASCFWLENTVFDASVPSGAILIWSGSVDAIPTGYVLCNGQNNTPDLRDRFIIGAGNSYSVGSTGGSTSHSHGLNVGSKLFADGTSSDTGWNGKGERSTSTNSTTTLPPYYALCYIMKT